MDATRKVGIRNASDIFLCTKIGGGEKRGDRGANSLKSIKTRKEKRENGDGILGSNAAQSLPLGAVPTGANNNMKEKRTIRKIRIK